MQNRDALIEYARIQKELACRKARADFWTFCHLLAPDFYREDRPHLKKLCNTLQDFHDGKLLKADGEPYKKLGIQLPPRFGKTRTLTNYSAWVLGLDNKRRIISASYGDDLACDFSRFTRDIIAEEKNLPDQIVYSDIFDAKIKYGDSSFKKWALEGQFFNYKGTGINSGVTGRGCSEALIDDPVENAEVAYNEMALDKIWLWYSGTFLSRPEEGARQIVTMTPWSKKDLLARLQEAEPGEWFLLSMPACENGVMLCPSLMSYKTYMEKKKVADANIFSANYDMIRLDVKGKLYSGFKTYSDIPQGAAQKVAYVDTADEGDDYLCAIHADKVKNYFYVTDVYYTKDAQEITEPMLCGIIKNAGTKDAMIESNNGGRAFARNIQRILGERGIFCRVQWFHQSKNKQARILTNASLIQEYIVFPEDWAKRWPEFCAALNSYQKEGKNKHDDAPDSLTGLLETYMRNTVSAPSTNIRGLAGI